MSIKKYLKSTLALLRVPTYLLLLQYVVVGLIYGLIVLNPITISEVIMPLIDDILVVLVMVATWYINGTALNDYADYEIDQINLKNDKGRPLVIGAINKQELLRISAVCGGIAFICASYLGAPTLILATCLILLNWAYSIKPIQLSRRGGIAPLLLPLGYVVLPLFSGFFLVSNNITAELIWLSTGLFLLFNARILLKDYRDVVGDAKFGKITFLLKYGTQKVCLVAASAFVLGVTLEIIVFWKILSVHIIPILFLTSLGVTVLYYLSQARKWPDQKPLIPIFGRINTGILILIALAFSFQLAPVLIWKQFIVSMAFVGLILTSISDIIYAQRK